MPDVSRHVSILVILELALEDGGGNNWSDSIMSFNPCYSGIGFRRSLIMYFKGGVVMFQSLLFWNWL